MVPFCRLHLESSDARNLRVMRGVVKTVRVVDGGDVLNFPAKLNLKVAYSECPLTARVRLGIALARFAPLLLRAGKPAGQQFNSGRGQTIAITTFHRKNVETQVKRMVLRHNSNGERNP